ncbi:MAG TPA: adenine deaminase [Desulfobacteraceae bacterium]|nr:adenine deaminase [Desulfobacteraceae bacterium]
MKTLADRIAVATKKVPADLVLKGGYVVNVFSHEVIEADVAICGEFIAAVGPGYVGEATLELSGKFVAPGLMDAHIHMESSMLHPRLLASTLLKCGTTSIIADPHEIANVAGLRGIDFMMAETRDLPFDVFFMAPSCVPASDLETSGAVLGREQLKELAQNPRILGLAEVMNYPGVVAGLPGLMEKIEVFRDKIIDGHCPGLSAEGLQAYVAAGMRSDHECTTRPEVLEKLRAGMMVMIREGTLAKNLEDLAPLINRETAQRFCLISDDLHPQDILQKGHLNYILRKAVSLGIDPVLAIELVTINPANFFRLYDRGAVAPGYRADLVVFNDLDGFEVTEVIKNGRLVVREGEGSDELRLGTLSCPESLRIMSCGPVSPDGFSIPCKGKNKARVIELIDGQIVTRATIEEIEGREGQLEPDTKRDVLKIAVIERHRGSGKIGLGLVHGFGLKRGAIASSVAHDSHNIVTVGAKDADMAVAVNEVIKMGGGLVVADGGSAVERLALPIAGLMTAEPLENVVRALDSLCKGARETLGCGLEDPFMPLSFLALPVIPELRVTDMGVVDVNQFKTVPLLM